MKPPPFKWAVLTVTTVFLFTSLWVFAHMFRYEVGRSIGEGAVLVWDRWEQRACLAIPPSSGRRGFPRTVGLLRC